METPTDPNGQEHALYVNDALSLLVNNSLFCDTATGHDIKSRALSTTVENSRIYVGTADTAVPGCSAGSTSLGVDVPNGGRVVVTGDRIFQGDNNQNGAMVSYGEEGLNYAVNSFAVSDTSFDNLGIRNSTGIQELKNGTATCLVPVRLSSGTFQNVTTPVNRRAAPIHPPRSPNRALFGCCCRQSSDGQPLARVRRESSRHKARDGGLNHRILTSKGELDLGFEQRGAAEREDGSG